MSQEKDNSSEALEQSIVELRKLGKRYIKQALEAAEKGDDVGHSANTFAAIGVEASKRVIQQMIKAQGNDAL